MKVAMISRPLSLCTNNWSFESLKCATYWICHIQMCHHRHGNVWLGMVLSAEIACIFRSSVESIEFYVSIKCKHALSEISPEIALKSMNRIGLNSYSPAMPYIFPAAIALSYIFACWTRSLESLIIVHLWTQFTKYDELTRIFHLVKWQYNVIALKLCVLRTLFGIMNRYNLQTFCTQSNMLWLWCVLEFGCQFCNSAMMESPKWTGFALRWLWAYAHPFGVNLSNMLFCYPA